MDNDMISKVAAVLAVVAIVISAAAIYMAMDDDDGNTTRHTMYFGLGDRSGSEADEIESFIENSLINDYGVGYTKYRASGGYLSGDTVLTDDTTLVFIIGSDGGFDYRGLADKVRSEFGLGSVYIETERVDSSLIL